MGDLAGARRYLEEALAIFTRVLGPQHPNTAASLNNMGLLLKEMRDLAGARPYLEEALAIWRKEFGLEHPHTAQSLNNLGVLLTAMGDLVGARPHLEEALAIRKKVLDPEHPHMAESSNNLGGLLRAMGDLAGARPYLEETLAIRRNVLGSKHPDTATSLSNLGCLLWDMGDLAGARPYLEEASAIRKRVLGLEHADTADSLNNLGALLTGLGHLSEAFALMEQAGAIDDRTIGQVFSIGSEHHRTAYLRNVQCNQDALLSLVWQHFRDSSGPVRAALALVLRRKAIGAEALSTQRDALLGGKYPHLASQLREWTTLRGQIAQKMLAGPGPEGPAAHRQQLAEWTARKERLEAELARQIPEMNLEQKLRAADRRAVALALPEGVALVEFVRFDVYDFTAVAQKVSGTEWIPPRRWKSARYLAFVLSAGEPDNVQLIDLGEAEPIDRMVADFRATITGEAERRAGRDRGMVLIEATGPAEADSGTALRSALWDKLLPALGGCKRLLLAPDGDLSRLPFEVLPTGDGRRMIDDYQISYVACGRDVLRFGHRSDRPPAEPLVVADPDFDLASSSAQPSPASPTAQEGADGLGVPAPAAARQSRDLDRERLRFDRLAGTHEEGEQIAAMLRVTPWLDVAALEARLKAVRSPRILHLATHGFFLKDQRDDPNELHRDLGAIGGEQAGGLGRLAGVRLENPLLRSGVALAGANTWLREHAPPEDAEDGLLTAEDVTGLDLLDTELVVLSACETGLGEVHVGEGVFGLRRSFVLAGADTLVMSLWKVPDEQTQELMEDFYRRILAGQSRADALREAQLDMKSKHPQPLYWGAWICQGDPAPLSNS